MSVSCKTLKAEITAALGVLNAEKINLTGLSLTTLEAIELGHAGGMPLVALIQMAKREREERAANPSLPPFLGTRRRAKNLTDKGDKKRLRRAQRKASKQQAE